MLGKKIGTYKRREIKMESFLIINTNDVSINDRIVVTGTVPLDATGNCSIYIKDENDHIKEYTAEISNGGFTLSFENDYDPGVYRVIGRYNGDENYYPCNEYYGMQQFTVYSTIYFDLIDNGNNSITILAYPSCMRTFPEGTIVLNIGNTNITIPCDEFEVSEEDPDSTYIKTYDLTSHNLVPGLNNGILNFSGDSKNPSNETTFTINIPKYDPVITITNNEYIQVGDTLDVLVTISENATGNIKCQIDGIEYTSLINNGSCTFNIAGLQRGTKTGIIRYDGDQYYNSKSETFTFDVIDRDTGLDINVKEETREGTDVIININLAIDATRICYARIRNVEYYGDTINGKCKIIVPDLSAGNYTGEVWYGGDDRYSASEIYTIQFKVISSNQSIS